MSGATTWLIKRNCSASPQQLALVFLSLLALSFGFGAAFAVHGLWMILPFVGLELVALAVAFVCYGRHAADYERIVLTEERVCVERVEADRREQIAFDRPWTRIEVSEQGQGGDRVRVELVSSGRSLEIGQHLTSDGRRRMAQELKTALRVHSAARAT